VVVTAVLREGKSLSVVVFPSLALVQQFSIDCTYVGQFANYAVPSCWANGTFLAGVYANYCCALEKAALPLLQLLADSELQPGFVLGVTITLRNPKGVRFAGQHRRSQRIV
jgi:hypothetical protein